MRRREFLMQAAAVASTGVGFASVPAAEPDPGRRLKIAVFSAMCKTMPLKTTIETVAAIGYDGIEIAAGYGTDHLDVNCTPARAREIKTVAGDHNLALMLIYTALGGKILAGEKQRAEGLEGVERFLAIGDQMSCKMVKVTAGRFKRAPLNAGNVDHRSLFRALQQTGYDGYLSCEAGGGDDPVAVAKHEYAEMQKLLRF